MPVFLESFAPIFTLRVTALEQTEERSLHHSVKKRKHSVLFRPPYLLPISSISRFGLSYLLPRPRLTCEHRDGAQISPHACRRGLVTSNLSLSLRISQESLYTRI
ncbi:hypothetical protein OF83DRAFT_99781 [Amylostereum chailletii]|nr:hypothetical protein OF83DRAFT_99781 [Amylostereum chailletii]